MRIHNNLPGYYNGLTREVVRSSYPALRATFPVAKQITKIPMVSYPVSLTDRYSLALNVSGVDPRDIAIVQQGNQLIVELEKEYNPDAPMHTNWDKCYGIYTRTFEMPEDIDRENIKFSVAEGVLTLDLYKDKAKKAGKVEEPKRPAPTPEAQL